MKLKELIPVLDRDTPVVIVDDMGPHNDVCTVGELSLVSFMWQLDREVKRVYLDTSDNTITIELEDFEPSDYE